MKKYDDLIACSDGDIEVIDYDYYTVMIAIIPVMAIVCIVYGVFIGDFVSVFISVPVFVVPSLYYICQCVDRKMNHMVLTSGRLYIKSFFYLNRTRIVEIDDIFTIAKWHAPMLGVCITRITTKQNISILIHCLGDASYKRLLLVVG